MQLLDDCLRHCHQLKELLEEDSDEMERCVEGKILEEYRKLMDKEIEAISQIIRDLRNLQNRF